MSIYLGHALNPDLQAIYEQVVTELSQYGRVQDRYYCRRLGHYVSEQEVQKVASLERTLDALEHGESKEHILELLCTDLPTFVDRSVHARLLKKFL